MLEKVRCIGPIPFQNLTNLNACLLVDHVQLPPSKSKIYWIDNRFDVGKMGNYYRAVPANTLNGDLCVAFELCKSFGWNQSQTIRKLEGKVTMQELAVDECFQLSTFVEALEDATSYMMPQCTTVIKGFVRSMQKDNGGEKWKIRIDGDEETLIETGAVIYACGGNASSPLIDSTVARKWSLDVLVDPCFVSKILRERPELINERWVGLLEEISPSNYKRNLSLKLILSTGCCRWKPFSDVNFDESRYIWGNKHSKYLSVI